MIGVFDSGFGGLSVLKNFLEECGDYDYIYLGDNARVPYGNKSPELIYNYTREAVDFLFKQDCRLIILACNTASALALRRLQQEYLPSTYPDRRILGVIKPIAEEAARNPRNSKIGVIATNATINSSVYKKEISKINREKTVLEQNTPLLVPLIEEGKTHGEALDLILEEYLKFLFINDVDELILGCTHYSLIFAEIKNKIPKTCSLLDPGKAVAQSLEKYLARHPELGIKKNNRAPVRKFYTTDCPKNFKIKGGAFLGQEIRDIEKIDLIEYHEDESRG